MPVLTLALFGDALEIISELVKVIIIYIVLCLGLGAWNRQTVT